MLAPKKLGVAAPLQPRSMPWLSLLLMVVLVMSDASGWPKMRMAALLMGGGGFYRQELPTELLDPPAYCTRA